MFNRFGKRTVNNIFLKKNKFDVLLVKNNDFLLKGLSSLDSNSLALSECLRGSVKYNFLRTNGKFTCSNSGKYGSPISYVPYNRFVFLKKTTFNELSILHKKS